MTEMDIAFFVKKDGEEKELGRFHNQTTVPFEKGDYVDLNVRNYGKEIWDVDDHQGRYKVLNIHTTFSKRYPSTGGIDSIKDNVFVDVLIEKYSNKTNY